MENDVNKPAGDNNLKCPECRSELKRRRSRNVDDCEMLCGVCGASFDVCDLETVEKLKSQP